jgi:hypothetical protein
MSTDFMKISYKSKTLITWNSFILYRQSIYFLLISANGSSCANGVDATSGVV